MIIDVTQNKESIDISYVGDNKQIQIETLTFDDEKVISSKGESNIRQFHTFVECGESDPNKHNWLRSFYDKPIKLEQSKRFTGHNLNYFLGYELPNFYPEIYEKTNKLIIPNLFFSDIETDITDKYGYSNQEKVENPVRSISFTDEKLNSILFIVKNPKHPEFSALDKSYIEGIIKTSLKHHANKYDYNFEIRVFDTEIEMLNYIIDCYRKYFHVLMGWNWYDFDNRYLSNRCDKLNLKWKNASPIGKLTSKRFEINQANHINIKVPTHRMAIDYMRVFKESLVYNNLGKYSLNFIADMILDLKKVSYDGNLRTLYDEDYLRFVAYALVDTIIGMLIHKATNLIGTEFFQSYYTGIPFLKLSQNSISEALIYQELMNSNQFLLESEYSTLPERPYQGGYVKDPTTKIVESVSGYDYGSLYPNSMITSGISPESKVDVLKVNSDGWPYTPEDIAKWNEYKKLGYCLTPAGRVYRMDKDYLFTRIEKKLLAERGIFKGHMNNIYMDLQTKIEEEIKKRGLKV